MKVEILNPEVLTELYRNHGEFARVCYDTPAERAEAVGKSCELTGHMSGSRCEYIKFRISGIDRGTAEQCLRHEIGVYVPFEMQDNYMWAEAQQYTVIDESPTHIVKNMASFRYIDKGNFEYAIPKAVKDNPDALKVYEGVMQFLAGARSDLKANLLQGGCDERTAIEAANMLMPRATVTEFVIGFTPEALIHFCHKRLCSRAQEFIREIAQQMKREAARYNEAFAKRLVPQCEYLLYCPEGGRCCGRRPTKKQVKAILSGKGGAD